MAQVTLINGTRFQAEPGTTLLDAALAQGLMLEHSCRTGRCGSCKAQVLTGDVVTTGADTFLDVAQRASGMVLTCVSEARGEAEVQLGIEDLKALAGIRLLTVPARIDRLERLAPDVLQVVLRLAPRSGFRMLAGQYVDVIGPSGLRRSYSVASDAASPDKIELQIRRVDGGLFSAWWFEQAKLNDLLRFQGPRGTFYLRDVAGQNLIFLATGTGYAPVQAMLHQLAAMPAADRPASVGLYWGGRTPQDLYLDPADWVEGTGLRYVPVLSRADSSWAGARGHVQDVLLADGHDLSTTSVYACGSPAMIESARHRLASAGLPATSFHSDAFVSSSS